MLIAIFFNYLTLLVIFGFSLGFKKIVFPKNKIVINNIDIFYGLIIILFFSLLLHFFFALEKLKYLIFLFGILLFIFGLLKKTYKINFAYYFLIISFTTFLAFPNGPNVDSPMYHLQILKYLNLEKISFGIASLEIRFGMNSSWHSIIALLDYKLNNFSSKFYLTSVLFGILLYEIFFEKKSGLKSNIFLFLAISYLLFFSFLHPFNNGVILNHLGNPETDIASMFFFFITIYIFIKNYEEFEIEKNKNLINLLIITSFLSITSRIATLPLLILPLCTFFFYKKYKFININNFLVFFVGLLWMIRSFFSSGCFIFPVKETCFKTFWATNINQVIFFYEETQSFAKDRNNYLDFEYTLYSYDWLIPWFKNYFLTTALLQISSALILVSLIVLLFKKIKFKNLKIFNSQELCLLISFLLCVLLWLRAPEIRFAWGLIIAIPCFVMALTISKFKFLDQIFIKPTLKNLGIIFFCSLMIYKHHSFINFENFFKIPNNDFSHTYSKLVKIGNFDGIDFYNSTIWQCADFKGVCVNTVRKEYIVQKKYGYTFYMANE